MSSLAVGLPLDAGARAPSVSPWWRPLGGGDDLGACLRPGSHGRGRGLPAVADRPFMAVLAFLPDEYNGLEFARAVGYQLIAGAELSGLAEECGL